MAVLMAAPCSLETSTLRSGDASEATRTTPNTTASSLPISITSDPVKDFITEQAQYPLDWEDYWSLRPELASVSRKEIKRQNSLYEIFTTEARYLQQVQVVICLFYYRLALEPSKIVSSGSNQEFAEKVFSFHQQFYHLHKTFLYDPLVKKQEAEGPWVTNFSDIFRRWLGEAAPIYLEFCGMYPHLISAVKVEAAKSVYFQRFLSQTEKHKLCNRLSWDNFMAVPITRLQRYVLLLQHNLKCSRPTDEWHEYQAMEKLNQDIKDLALKCDAEISRALDEVQVERLRAQINSTLSDGVISSDANILFDEDLSYQKRGFGRAARLRVVVLGSAGHSAVLVLSKIPKLTQISDDTDSYELVIQVSRSYG